MKKANFIISHLQSTPSLKNLQKNQCYKKLLSLLPDSLQKGISFLYNKNNTLFFVLKHPVYKAEFYHKKSIIENLLKTLAKIDSQCSCIEAKDIKFFITKKNTAEFQEPTNNTIPIYREQSNGSFKNSLSNKKIYKLFEDIRVCIKNSSKL